jgi:CheY-like chemotaxis protein
VIVDIFMPGMDGLETVRALHRRLPDVPIIIMSGLTFRSSAAFGPVAVPDFLSMALEFGAACALHKPFAPEALFQAIEACLPSENPAICHGAALPGDGRIDAPPAPRQR